MVQFSDVFPLFFFEFTQLMISCRIVIGYIFFFLLFVLEDKKFCLILLAHVFGLNDLLRVFRECRQKYYKLKVCLTTNIQIQGLF